MNGRLVLNVASKMVGRCINIVDAAPSRGWCHKFGKFSYPLTWRIIQCLSSMKMQSTCFTMRTIVDLVGRISWSAIKRLEVGHDVGTSRHKIGKK